MLKKYYGPPRKYAGFAGVLMCAPHISELSDEAAQAKWWDVFHYGGIEGYESGRIAGLVEASKRDEQERTLDQQHEDAHLQIVVDALRTGVSYPELCRRRGEHDRAERAQKLYDARNINSLDPADSPYWRQRRGPRE